jgi:hypothetical protein
VGGFITSEGIPPRSRSDHDAIPSYAMQTTYTMRMGIEVGMPPGALFLRVMGFG